MNEQESNYIHRSYIDKAIGSLNGARESSVDTALPELKKALIAIQMAIHKINCEIDVNPNYANLKHEDLAPDDLPSENPYFAFEETVHWKHTNIKETIFDIRHLGLGHYQYMVLSEPGRWLDKHFLEKIK